MKGGLGNLMRQAQQLQDSMREAQEQLAELKITGSAGGGMVKVHMNGNRQVDRVEIDPHCMEDAEVLEDLVAAAINDAVNRIEETTRDKFSGLASGLGNLPAGLKLPF